MTKKKSTNRKRGAVIRSTAGLSGVELIQRERARQISKEGWTPKHDDTHKKGELAMAGAIYAVPPDSRAQEFDDAPDGWPWSPKWWKPSPNDRVKELVKAGALIAAEIDRLQRAQAR